MVCEDREERFAVWKDLALKAICVGRDFGEIRKGSTRLRGRVILLVKNLGDGNKVEKLI